MQKGNVVQIMGPVVDVEFGDEKGLSAQAGLPALQTALKIKREGKKDLVLEVAQHLGGNRVRTLAMDSTDGLQRKEEVESTGAPISVPIGEQVLGRVFDVLGNPIDGKGEVKGERSSIYQPAPPLEEQKTEPEVFETGIKVIDLLAPILKGGKVGLFGGAGVGKTVLLQELIANTAR
ncbi:MAG TPA: F0F1 ATP synthase subunit beta, partial [Candidatus Paceibacterota bacterium]|nr:F0F1 ATP synthase subunit beta [Candidatus Paceibacterota bacterium]